MAVNKISDTKIEITVNDKVLIDIEREEIDIEIILTITGALKTNVAEDFSDILMENLKMTDMLVLDFKNIPYIASAGLRALLNAQQHIDDIEPDKNMIIKNINDEVRDVFESTGFINILNVEGK